MGQKVNPNSFRFGLNKNWVSRWNSPSPKVGIRWLLEDEKIRKLVSSTFKDCGVGHIEIERFYHDENNSSVVVYVHVVQVGLFHTKERETSVFNRELKRIVGRRVGVKVQGLELKNPSVSSVLLCQEIVDTIQNRLSHRMVVKRILRKAMMAGAEGIKVKISGRINGVEIARSESYSDGSVPLSTLRADIDYSFQTAKTPYGIIGVKVWVNRGLYFGKNFMPLPPAPQAPTYKSKENKYIATTY